MKELTTEQKAQRYDEAIKVAKSNYETIVQMDEDCTFSKEGIVNTFHHMFPELKENKDESIRKWLIEMVEEIRKANPTNADHNGKCSEAIAWLEKQGKSNMGISEDTKQKLEDNLNKALQKETLESCNEFLERQGEQKHIPKHKVGDTIYYNSFGEVKSMIVANVVTDSTDNPMYEDKEYNAVFEKDLIEQNSADNLDTLIEESNQQQANALIDMVTEERDMTTITEDYVSFEVAKLLKEKGFDWCTYAYYEDEDNPNINLHASKAINWNKTEFISKPTLQRALKWLRKVHNFHIWVEPNNDKKDLYNAHVKVGQWSNNWAGIGYNTHEKACEAAIKYCLENLI